MDAKSFPTIAAFLRCVADAIEQHARKSAWSETGTHCMDVTLQHVHVEDWPETLAAMRHVADVAEAAMQEAAEEAVLRTRAEAAREAIAKAETKP